MTQSLKQTRIAAFKIQKAIHTLRPNRYILHLERRIRISTCLIAERSDQIPNKNKPFQKYIQSFLLRKLNEYGGVSTTHHDALGIHNYGSAQQPKM